MTDNNAERERIARWYHSLEHKHTPFDGIHKEIAFNAADVIIDATKQEVEKAKQKIKAEIEAKYLEVLSFYANPETYFAIGFFPDNPAGEFMDDFSETGLELGLKPGKRARDVLFGELK